MIHLDEEIKTIVRMEILSRMADYKKIDFCVIGKNEVVAGIEDAISSIKPDMLAMFTHRRDVTDKLLGRGVTRHLAFLNKLPLMVVNRTTSRQ